MDDGWMDEKMIYSFPNLCQVVGYYQLNSVLIPLEYQQPHNEYVQYTVYHQLNQPIYTSYKNGRQLNVLVGHFVQRSQAWYSCRNNITFCKYQISITLFPKWLINYTHILTTSKGDSTSASIFLHFKEVTRSGSATIALDISLTRHIHTFLPTAVARQLCVD